MAHAQSFVAIQKDDGQTYLFLYQETQTDRQALFKTLRRFAADKELNFTTQDAARIAVEVMLASKNRKRQTK